MKLDLLQKGNRVCLRTQFSAENPKSIATYRVAMLFQWMTISSVILNMISLLFVVLTVQYIRRITSQCDSIVSSTRSLARCAVRLKVGSTAKKSILEYAKTIPELAELLEREAAIRASMELLN